MAQLPDRLKTYTGGDLGAVQIPAMTINLDFNIFLPN